MALISSTDCLRKIKVMQMIGESMNCHIYNDIKLYISLVNDDNSFVQTVRLTYKVIGFWLGSIIGENRSWINIEWLNVVG